MNFYIKWLKLKNKLKEVMAEIKLDSLIIRNEENKKKIELMN
jgi:hypothetical protein